MTAPVPEPDRPLTPEEEMGVELARTFPPLSDRAVRDCARLVAASQGQAAAQAGDAADDAA